MKKRWLKHLKISIFAAFLLSGVVIVINPGSNPWLGWFRSALFSFIFIFIILVIFDKFHSPAQVKTITFINLFLRILTGIALFLLLPIWGYEAEPPQAGYLYLDAYRRDNDAWQIASTHGSILSSFRDEFYTDQYGGMLALSAAIYRIFSPDAHRPTLILLLTSFISTLGIPFYWQALNERFNRKIAYLACWILALYPESVILGGSQMREPLIIGLSGIVIWGLERFKKDKRSGISILLLSMLMLTLISSLYSAAIFFLIVLWIWFDRSALGAETKPWIWRYLPAALIVIVGFFLSWRWLVDASSWDLYVMESSSGRVQFELDAIGEQFRIPFLVLYGVLQPVLPAAIVYPGIPIMRSIAIIRSLGWYLIGPTLLLAPFLTRREEDKKNRTVLMLVTYFLLFWILLSSLRAGGDQWDNPRYRTAMLPWIALISSWIFLYCKEKKNIWLKRIFSIVTVFCLFFLHWYLSRYYKLWRRLPFVKMVILLAATMAGMLVGFFLYDYMKQRKKSGE